MRRDRKGVVFARALSKDDWTEVPIWRPKTWQIREKEVEGADKEDKRHAWANIRDPPTLDELFPASGSPKREHVALRRRFDEIRSEMKSVSRGRVSNELLDKRVPVPGNPAARKRARVTPALGNDASLSDGEAAGSQSQMLGQMP